METRNKLNQRELFKDLFYTGENHMPKVDAYLGEVPQELMSFHRARALKQSESSFIHFYEDDEFFNCVWNAPAKYIPLFKRFAGVIGTDYSVYANMTKPEVMWNSFRNKSITAALQKNGIPSIPNVSWSKEWSLDFCFEGYPTHSVIAINSTGIRKDLYSRTLWRRGYEKAIETLEPIRIIRYGAKQEGELESISVYYPNDNFKSAGHGR